MEAQSASVVETLTSLSLFADLSYPELEPVAHTFAEEAFAKDQRVLRQDVSGGSFYVILSGEARVVIDGEERAALSRGDFFGEISVLTDTAPTAEVIVRRAMTRSVAARIRSRRRIAVDVTASALEGGGRGSRGSLQRAQVAGRGCPTTATIFPPQALQVICT